MVAIFPFFHNGWHWHSISVDTWKTRDPDFGGSVIWKFSIWCIFTKWWPYFDFFIMVAINILFLSTLRKPETQTLEGGLVIRNFLYNTYLCNGGNLSIFFIMANADIPFPKWKFSIGSVSHYHTTSSLVQFQHSSMMMFLHLNMCGHSCVITFLHLKVHNDWCKFSIGSVFQVFPTMLGLVSTV